MAAEVGNRYAANRKRWQHAIERALARKAGSISAGLDRLADSLVDEALKGDKEARREIWDRLDGKPAQMVDAQVTVTDERVLSDAELLAAIAEGAGSDGAAAPEGDPPPPEGVVH